MIQAPVTNPHILKLVQKMDIVSKIDFDVDQSIFIDIDSYPLGMNTTCTVFLIFHILNGQKFKFEFKFQRSNLY